MKVKHSVLIMAICIVIVLYQLWFVGLDNDKIFGIKVKGEIILHSGWWLDMPASSQLCLIEALVSNKYCWLHLILLLMN